MQIYGHQGIPCPSQFSGLASPLFAAFLFSQHVFPLFFFLTDSLTDAKTPLAVNALHHDLIKAKAEGRPVERLVLSDLPAMSTSNAIAITKASKNKEAAAVLVKFLLSDEGQEMIGNSSHPVRVPGNENVNAKYFNSTSSEFAAFYSHVFLNPHSVKKLGRKTTTRKLF